MKLLIFTLLPFLNFLTLFLKKENNEICQKFSYQISKIFAISSIAILISFLSKFEIPPFEFLKFNSEISFFIEIHKSNVFKLFLVSLIWLFSIYYFQAFLSFQDLKTRNENQNFIKFLPIFIGFLNIIILSKNLPTLLFSYGFLSIICAFIFQKYLLIEKNQKSQIFINLFFLEIILSFIFLTLVVNFSNSSEFLKNGLAISANKINSFLIFLSFFLMIFSTISLPAFLLFYKNINFKLLINFLILILFFGFAKITIFTTIISKSISIGLFSIFINQFYSLLIEIIFAISIIFSLILIIFTTDFKKTFLYLFFNQLNCTFLAIFIILKSDKIGFEQVFYNFILLIILTFVILQNFILYLKNSQNKEFDGIFYKLKITISLLIFALLNFASILPPLILQNYSLIKIFYQNQFFVSILIFFINSIGILLFSYKLIFATFSKEIAKNNENDIILAKKIDFSSQLSLTAFCIAFIIVLQPILKIFI